MGKLRFYFFDNLRVIAIMLVIAHHAAMPYGPTGGAWLIHEAAEAQVLDAFFTVNRSFGMSLFFMIAGFFTVLSVDRIGPRAFIRNRLARLGLPLVAIMLVFTLLGVFVFGAHDGELGRAWPLEAGHLWFVQHLLVYSLVYGVWRMLRPRRAGAPEKLAPVPRWWAVVAFALLLGFASGTVRIWYPVDDWHYVLGFLRVAWADVPRDLSLFVLGAVACRQQWVTRFPTRSGMAWLGAGLFLAAACYAYDMGLSRLLGLSQTAADVIEIWWESLLCCSLCIGLTVLFREKANVQTRLLKWLADGQYTAYIIHVFVVLGFQLLLAGAAIAPLGKFALVTLASVPATFALAGLIDQAPRALLGLRRLLSRPGPALANR